VGDEAADRDMDGVADHADLCPSVPDQEQLDSDHDGLGDACDTTPCGPGDAAPPCEGAAPAAPQVQDGTTHDRDADGVPDAADDCPGMPNRSQLDRDGDMRGDACDEDMDGDGVVNVSDDCPLSPDPRQEGASLCEAAAESEARGRGAAVGKPATADTTTAPLLAVAGSLLVVAVFALMVASVARRK
ncbi:MAG: thrombospondin type 3 repeat-containing protein, partial [Halobacteriales archaeon]|nr:thrombospondin type 3 repeat-containing protein [Halobacteriales archaeon]